MTQHLHSEFQPWCFRCDLSRDELRSADPPRAWVNYEAPGGLEAGHIKGLRGEGGWLTIIGWIPDSWVTSVGEAWHAVEESDA